MPKFHERKHNEQSCFLDMIYQGCSEETYINGGDRDESFKFCHRFKLHSASQSNVEASSMPKAAKEVCNGTDECRKS